MGDLGAASPPQTPPPYNSYMQGESVAFQPLPAFLVACALRDQAGG